MAAEMLFTANLPSGQWVDAPPDRVRSDGALAHCFQRSESKAGYVDWLGH